MAPTQPLLSSLLLLVHVSFAMNDWRNWLGLLRPCAPARVWAVASSLALLPPSLRPELQSGNASFFRLLVKPWLHLALLGTLRVRAPCAHMGLHRVRGWVLVQVSAPVYAAIYFPVVLFHPLGWDNILWTHTL